MPSQSEQELAHLAQQGDLDAFGEMIRRHQDGVFRLCYRMLGNYQDAEDLTQEAFIRCYKHRQKYDPTRPFGPWICRIAANLCLNRLQARSPFTDQFDDELQNLPSVERGPEAVHENADQSQQVQAALFSLPPHYRAVIELRHFQDQSYAQIAEALNLPLSDVKSHLFRARKQLAALLNSPVPNESAHPHLYNHSESDL